MLLKISFWLSMLLQIGAAVIAISMIRRTRYNISWIFFSLAFVLMAVRRLFDFSMLFWDNHLFRNENVNNWLGVLVSALLFVGLVFIRWIFNLQDRIDQIRKESESRILSAVINTEEKDRQIFARELHDGLGPVLSSIKMTMSAIDTESLDLSNKKIVERSCIATDEAISALKEISNNLSPHLLDNYGLIAAVEQFAERLLTGTSVIFNITSGLKDKRLAYDLEINLYRIVCELLHNSIKHASPKFIELDIREENSHLSMKYKDDGLGFIPTGEFEYNSPGMGIENIRSRIKSLNGSFNLESFPGAGLLIDIQIPLV